jgi:hypothetical protein
LINHWGAEASKVEDRNVLPYFFDLSRRMIPIGTRKIEIADDFDCPPAQKNGWINLQDKIRRGDDLGPHLSWADSFSNNDGLLNEWGVHHFHLGMKPDTHRPYYVERSTPLLFALVDETTVYAINIYRHGAWEDKRIIESLHRNWPDLISRDRLQGIQGEVLTTDERRKIRKSGLQAAIATEDGSVYGSIGGPINSIGLKLQSMIDADRWIDEVRRLQSGLEAHLCKVLPVLEQAGYTDEQELRAELHITNYGYQAFFPRYDVHVQINMQ